MGENINRVKEIDVSTVEGNKTLSTCLDQRAIERCKDTIEKLGLLHTPIIGATGAGKHLVLSGQAELTALRELGVKKMDAISVDIPPDGGNTAKLALLLMSLRGGADALCEGLLLQEAVGAGVPRAEIQAMLGRSASWVSNRISMVTRLDSGVFEMVRGGLLDPRSAQEVARLPAGAQFAFAETAVREGLPKSSIESLVAGYNDEGCPDMVKEQVLSDPKAALRRMADKRRAVNAGYGPSGPSQRSAPPEDIGGCIKEANMQMGRLCGMIINKSPYEISKHTRALKELETEVAALLLIIRKLLSPGKKEVAYDAG